MKTFISPPPFTMATVAIHRRLPHTTTFSPSPVNHLFHFLTAGNTKFTDLTCKVVYKANNKDIPPQSNLLVQDQQDAVKKYVDLIKSILSSVDEGDLTPSAYDTAWVALIEDVNGQSGRPQFPSCLQWIVNHQLPDGSWGEPSIFSAFDRLLNTLACVVALTSWNISPNMCEKGIKFMEKNLNKLKDEKDEHITPGFELVFTTLIEMARKLDIKLPGDSHVLKDLYMRRDVKLAKIPKDIYHKKPTILLYSLEGMKNLEWEKLLKLQSEDGSFGFSPAATTFAFMQTKDQKCLAYLTKLVDKFNGGVPNAYPIDMFERIWIVDRLQRLGIDRYFISEINDFLDYIYRYWHEQGIGFARNCNLPDIDDTAMAFRLLRINGYDVSPDVFQHFEKEGRFFCYPGQSAEAVTVMLNLFRASQVLFPEEKILNDAKKFSIKFLTEKQSSNELLDKWIIAKDLSSEVGYMLDVPWYATLRRLDARYYLEQYGGEDIWIAKTLYKLKKVTNNKYLEMAKLDYNHCQVIHQLEWSQMQKWCVDLNIEEGLNTRVLWSYYEAMSSIFEPERRIERIAWAKTNVLLETITSLFTKPEFSNDDMRSFIDEFTNTQHDHETYGKQWNHVHVVMDALHETLKQISLEALNAHGINIYPHLHHAWTMWFSRWKNGDNVAKGEAELIVQTINMSNGRWLPEQELLSRRQYQQLTSITNDLCHQLSHKENHSISLEIESKMQELVQLVLCDALNDLDPNLKHTFLTVAKTFYYRAYFDTETIYGHIDKVLFQNVI